MHNLPPADKLQGLTATERELAGFVLLAEYKPRLFGDGHKLRIVDHDARTVLVARLRGRVLRGSVVALEIPHP